MEYGCFSWFSVHYVHYALMPNTMMYRQVLIPKLWINLIILTWQNNSCTDELSRIDKVFHCMSIHFSYINKARSRILPIWMVSQQLKLATCWTCEDGFTPHFEERKWLSLSMVPMELYAAHVCHFEIMADFCTTVWSTPSGSGWVLKDTVSGC